MKHVGWSVEGVGRCDRGEELQLPSTSSTACCIYFVSFIILQPELRAINMTKCAVD